MQRWIAGLLAFALVGTGCSGGTDDEVTETALTSETLGAGDEPANGSTSSTPAAQETVDPALLVELPVDPELRVGMLDNGLTYYIRFNDSPGNRAELRLAVDAGSVLEEPDQSGGAHFLEHMMFNGTEKYPQNELIAVLEGFGPQFGPDINAYTSFDETVYELSVPTEDPAILEEAIEVLIQWADHASLTPQDVENERGVVVEEWRVRDQGLNGRVGAAFGDLMLAGTPYEGQLPIGDFESISTMDSEPLRRFYEQWYRPELMAVVVVGDFDVDDVEQMIKDRFSDLESSTDAVERPDITVAPTTGPAVVTLADPEATSSSVDVLYMVDVGESIRTVGDLQETVVLGMAMQMMENRLVEDALRGQVPFYSAGTYDLSYSRAISAVGMSVSADATEIESSTTALLTEIARASRFGFSDSEFDRARESLIALNEQLLEGQDSRQDSQFAAGFVAGFLSRAHVPSIDQFYGIQKDVLDRITLADVESAFVELVTTSAPRIFVVGPDEPAGVVPSDAVLLALIDEVAALDLEPRAIEAAAPDELMSAPDPVEPINVAVNPFFDYLELDYANGARVIFWQTDIAENLVTLSASSFGGSSQVEEEDLMEIEYGVDMIAQSGLGNLDQVTVDRVVSDRIVSLFPWFSLTHEGFVGTAGTEDLETLFQWLHLAVVEPRIDEVRVSSVLTEARPMVESPEDVPQLMASIALSASYYGPDDTRHWVIPPLDEFNDFDSDRALEVYRDRFGNVGDFLFVFVGDTTEDVFGELANRYIGTLPGSPHDEGFVDYQPLPTGEQITTVEAGQDDQGSVQFQFTNNLETQDVVSDVVVDLLELIGSNRLRDRIREALSATYSPFMALDAQLEPDPYLETYVEVSGDPERLDEIAVEVLADVADLRANGPTAEELEIAQEQLFREYELINNPFLAERVIFFEEHDGREIDELIRRYEIIELVTAADIKAMAKIAFPVGSYIEVKLIPAP